MFGPPQCAPPDAIILRLHWNYKSKADGSRHARLCCDGSPGAVPELNREAEMFASMWRMSVALATALDHIIFGGNAKDAYEHSPGPSRPTLARLDDAFIEWYNLRFGQRIPRDQVLPILSAL